jgi:hypothetical protein
LTGNAGDGLATGKTVPDSRADGSAAHQQAATDHGAGEADCVIEPWI